MGIGEAADLRVLVVTVSDTRDSATDLAGPAIRDALEAAGAIVVRVGIIRDEASLIRDLLLTVADADEADAVVLSGGTGIAPRDITPETLAGLYTKALDGFGEAFRRLSWDQIGPRAVFSRATAGTIDRLVVFSLPGSTRGALLGTRELVIPMLRHAVDLANGRTEHAESVPSSRAATRTPSAPASSVSRPAGASSPVRILYFAALRDYAETDEEAMDLPANVATVEALLAHVESKHPSLKGRLQAIRVARNERMVTSAEPIVGGDVVALLPPFAGG